MNTVLMISNMLAGMRFLLVIISTITRYVESDFIPDCSQRCSGLTHRSGIDYNKIKADSCEAELRELESYPSFALDSKSPLTDILIVDYSTMYFNPQSSADKEYENSDLAGVNITFKYHQDIVGQLTGVTFYRQCTSPDSQYKQSMCRGYTFKDTLEAQDVADEQGNEYVHFFDCIRGHEPGFEYQYLIKLESNSSLGSQVYRFLHRSPACSFKPNNYHCKKEYDYMNENVTEKNLPMLWKPQYIEVLSVEYEGITVRFELAPDEYVINAYNIQIVDSDGNRHGTEKKIFVDVPMIKMTQYYGRSVEYIEVNLTDIQTARNGSQLSIKLIPAPNPNTCIDFNGQPANCSQTQSKFITVYENPCKRGIANAIYCGKDEVCIALGPGQGHECVCKAGYIKLDDFCVVNGCFSNNPCGQGQCTPHSYGNYTCKCDEGYIVHGDTCKVNPCASNQCNPYGTCQLQTRGKEPSYTCDCDANFVDNKTTCTEDICATKDPCGPNSKHCDVLSDPMCTCNYHYVYKQGKGCVVSPTLLAAIIFSCLAFIGILVLAIFCWKCPSMRKWFREKIWATVICNKCSSASVSQCPSCGAQIQVAWEHGSVRVRPPNSYAALGYHQESSTVGYHQESLNEDSIESIPLPVHTSHPIEKLSISCNDPVEYKLIFTTMMKKANVLILFANDDPQHVKVVQAFANFLQVDENKFSVSLPCWEELQIAAEGWQSWFSKKLSWANKVLLVASKAKYRTDTGYFKYTDQHFERGINHIIDISLNSRTTSSKFQIVYFENPKVLEHIPPFLMHLPKYRLMKQMESLYFKLHDIEQYEPGKEKEAPWLTDDTYIEYPEGKTLFKAIHSMKNIQIDATNNNDEGYLSRKVDSNSPLISHNSSDGHVHSAQLPHGKNQLITANPLFQQSADSFEDHFREFSGKNPDDSDFDSVYSSASTSVLYNGALGNKYAPTRTEIW